MKNQINEPFILSYIRIIDNFASKYGDFHLKEIGLTHSQANVIIILAHQEKKKIHQRDIEQALNLTNPTVSVLLNRLEEKNFIKRISDPEDSRARIILLTDNAQKLVDNIYEKMTQIEKKVLNGFSENEIQMVSQLMKRIADNAIESS